MTWYRGIQLRKLMHKLRFLSFSLYMQSLNLSNQELAAKTALQRILRPRYLHVVEPWVLRASPEERRLVGRLLRTVREAGSVKVACVVNENGVCVPISETTLSIDALQVAASTGGVRGSMRPRSAPAAVNLRTTRAAEIYSMNFQRLAADACVHRMCQQWVVRGLEIYQVAVHNRADATDFLHLLRQIFAFAESVGSQRPKTASAVSGRSPAASERLYEASKTTRLVVEATAAVIQHRLVEDTQKKKAVMIVGRGNVPASHARPVVKSKPVQPNNIFISRVTGTLQTTYSRDFRPLQVTSWQHA